MGKEIDKKIAKAESDAKRHKKKSCKPQDNKGDGYVTGLEQMRTQGKGDKYRVIEGWYSEEMTDKFNKIFEKRHKQWDENRTSSNGKTIKYYPPSEDE